MKYNVDLEKAEQSVKSLQKFINIGGYGAVSEIPPHISEPKMVMSTDGVGSKLLVAPIETIGQDLVAMNVNDILCTGGYPYYFCDYLAVSHMDVKKVETIVRGIKKGCDFAQCKLIGGETAEMPDLYKPGEFDLGGFAVGFAEKNELIDMRDVREGHALVAIQSSGPHSNGFELLRRIVEASDEDWNYYHELTEPTKIYVGDIHSVRSHFGVHGMAHITGGGLTGNIPRIIPDGLQAVLNLKSEEWQLCLDEQPYWSWIMEQAGMSVQELCGIFNYGVGMVLAVSQHNVKPIQTLLSYMGTFAFQIGTVERSTTDSKITLME